ncbi:MAG: hypothetical protein C4521_07645 [Actinobacteria bacterium]|nr:MAG: hypothetical protein C4521_07645 [Actinomycetota bacterium]
MIDWDELLHRWITLTEAEKETLWARAEIAYRLTRVGGVVDVGQEKRLASEVGVSAAYVRKLAQTYVAFKDPDTRAQDMSFEHHYIASLCPDPQVALDRAIEHGWSAREMKAILRPSTGPRKPLERAKEIVKRLTPLDRLRFTQWFHAQYGEKAR